MEHSGMHVEPTTHMLSSLQEPTTPIFEPSGAKPILEHEFKAQLKVKLASSLSLNDNSVLQLKLKSHISSSYRNFALLCFKGDFLWEHV